MIDSLANYSFICVVEMKCKRANIGVFMESDKQSHTVQSRIPTFIEVTVWLVILYKLMSPCVLQLPWPAPTPDGIINWTSQLQTGPTQTSLS